MDKVEWPEDQLDYSDSITIKITKVKFGGEFTHWEAKIEFSETNEYYCEVTAPNMVGALDEVMNYLYDSVPEWTRSDANKPQGKLPKGHPLLNTYKNENW
jgi:hypothetical protein